MIYSSIKNKKTIVNPQKRILICLSNPKILYSFEVLSLEFNRKKTKQNKTKKQKKQKKKTKTKTNEVFFKYLLQRRRMILYKKKIA